MIIDDPGDDVVLDVSLQTPDKEPFAAVETANEILFDGRVAEAVDTFINAPPGTTDSFRVHARVRRIADGVASDIVTIDVPLDDVPPDVRVEWVGCSCTSTSPSSSLPAGLLLFSVLGVRKLSKRRR
ncbi:MAG: MYXO-CTERM sorting domain-containing protein [Deltaproteobacteria bacterium]|nr:MYXO-CTERM sorting domain-containing protein [Deltaproteobacteria bacterium]